MALIWLCCSGHSHRRNNRLEEITNDLDNQSEAAMKPFQVPLRVLNISVLDILEASETKHIDSEDLGVPWRTSRFSRERRPAICEDHENTREMFMYIFKEYLVRRAYNALI